jgi:hypothetical protein
MLYTFYLTYLSALAMHETYYSFSGKNDHENLTPSLVDGLLGVACILICAKKWIPAINDTNHYSQVELSSVPRSTVIIMANELVSSLNKKGRVMPLSLSGGDSATLLANTEYESRLFAIIALVLKECTPLGFEFATIIKALLPVPKIARNRILPLSTQDLEMPERSPDQAPLQPFSRDQIRSEMRKIVTQIFTMEDFSKTNKNGLAKKCMSPELVATIYNTFRWSTRELPESVKMILELTSTSTESEIVNAFIKPVRDILLSKAPDSKDPLRLLLALNSEDSETHLRTFLSKNLSKLKIIIANSQDCHKINKLQEWLTPDTIENFSARLPAPTQFERLTAIFWSMIENAKHMGWTEARMIPFYLVSLYAFINSFIAANEYEELAQEGWNYSRETIPNHILDSNLNCF